VLLPRKKSRLIKRADPVHIKGFLNNPSIRIIPWKTAVTTYGTWFFAPYLFVGVWAADLFTETVKIRAKKNPCLEYERKHDQEHEADEHGTQP
jgi:CDP-diglyceride synthetase